MNSKSDNREQQTAAEFAQQLRARAQQAAAASVQCAGLSERYLDISSQFAALAEKVSTTSTSDLQAALKSIESSMAQFSLSEPLSATGITATQPAAQSVTEPKRSLPELGRGSVTAAPVAGDTSAVGRLQPEAAAGQGGQRAVTGADHQKADSAESAVTSVVPPKLRRTRRVNTRTIVKRARSAEVAAVQKVHVKASKDELKPQLRNTLEELSDNRGSILTSVTLVVLTLFVLSLITLQLEIEIPPIAIVASFADEITDIEEPLPVEIPQEQPGEQQEEKTEEAVEEPEPDEDSEDLMDEAEATEEKADESVADVESAAAAAAADAADNRSAAGRQRMLQEFGGSVASESAVQRGLDWLVSVQHPRGWWNFTHVGEAGNPGRVNNPIGATSYALLPFLAAGQTHRDGKYRQQVRAGLDYLCGIGVSAPAGYDLRGVLNKGNRDEEPNEAYYVHGAATLVLCEAYGMTRDRRLRKPAEGALRFLLNSQDPRGGGWRYLPQQPGSTSVTAVQVMALMAAKKAGMKVPAAALSRVMHYLDSVQVDGEGRYGYEAGRKTYKGSVTAMALLCRMYLGWERDDGDMRAGVALLDKAGPWDNLYTTYFATQVMRNWGGDEWVRWNERVRDNLIATQVTDGPGMGSWSPRKGMHTRSGGRLLETSLATLTLEVYYRHRPILPDAAGRDRQSEERSANH